MLHRFAWEVVFWSKASRWRTKAEASSIQSAATRILFFFCIVSIPAVSPRETHFPILTCTAGGYVSVSVVIERRIRTAELVAEAGRLLNDPPAAATAGSDSLLQVVGASLFVFFTSCTRSEEEECCHTHFTLCQHPLPSIPQLTVTPRRLASNNTEK